MMIEKPKFKAKNHLFFHSEKASLRYSRYLRAQEFFDNRYW